MSKQEKLLLLVLGAVNFTNLVDFMILMPLGPNLIRVFGINAAEFGYLVASYGLSAGLSGFIFSFYADRFDRKKLLLIAYTGFLICTFFCALSDSYGSLMIARVFTGIFGGVIGSLVLSIVADVFQYERRATAMGVIMTAFSVAAVAGVPGGLYLATKFDWEAPFFFVAGVGVFVLSGIYYIVPSVAAHLDTDQPREKPIKILTNIINNSKQMWALLLSTVIMMGHFSIIPYISPSLVYNAGYRESDIYLIYLCGGAFTIFTSQLVGRLADRYGKYNIFKVFALFSLIPIFLITHLSPQPLVYILAVAVLFFIMANGRVVPLQAMVSNVVEPHNRGGFMAINSSVQLMAQAIATSIGGLIIIQQPSGYLDHYDYVGYFAITMIVIGIFVGAKLGEK